MLEAGEVIGITRKGDPDPVAQAVAIGEAANPDAECDAGVGHPLGVSNLGEDEVSLGRYRLNAKRTQQLGQIVSLGSDFVNEGGELITRSAQPLHGNRSRQG
jgi:antitoxin (DNA-binding transcriptional repressor) of toxin-antitoxin stability system